MRTINYAIMYPGPTGYLLPADMTLRWCCFCYNIQLYSQ